MYIKNTQNVIEAAALFSYLAIGPALTEVGFRLVIGFFFFYHQFFLCFNFCLNHQINPKYAHNHSITILKLFKIILDILKIITIILDTALLIFLMSAIRFLIDMMRQYTGTRVKSNHSSHYIFSSSASCFSFSFILVFLLIYIFQYSTNFGIISVELIIICNYFYSWSLLLITLTFAVALIIAFTYALFDEELNLIYIIFLLFIIWIWILKFSSPYAPVSPYHFSSGLFNYKSYKISKISKLYKSKYFYNLSKLNDYNKFYNIYIAVFYCFFIIILTYPYSFYTYESYPCDCPFYPPCPFLLPCILPGPHYNIPDLLLHPYFSSPVLPSLFTSAPFLCTSAPAPAPASSREVIILPPIEEEPEFTNPLDPDNIFGLQFKFEGGGYRANLFNTVFGGNLEPLFLLQIFGL